LSERPIYLVLNRFDDEFGEYHRFTEGLDCELVHLTLPAGLAVLDQDGALQTVVVESLDLDTVLPIARDLARRHGEFAGVVGISERDVLTAARLRMELDTPGWTPEYVTRFLDKPRMKELVGGAGLRVPRYLSLDQDTDAQDVVARLGLPVVLKPRAGAASRGVSVHHDVAGLAAALAEVDPAEHECEEYVEGQVLHADGVRRHGKFHYVSVSEYIDTCLGFTEGRSLGSVLLDAGAERDRIAEFAGHCLDALGQEDGAFHLELFRTGTGELVFLEVGMRPGGGEIGFIHRDVLGIDLFGEAFRAALDLPVLTMPEEFADPSGGGFVMVPERGPLPSRVVSRTPMAGVVPEVYAEVLPEVGSVFDGKGGYYHIGGRFRLRGKGYADVHRAATEIIENYELVVVPEGPGADRRRTGV
jgi:hypothetical protein